MALASPEQFEFFLDAEIWHGSGIAQEKARTWFGYLSESGEERLLEILPRLDPELLVLFLKREIMVGGGIGDLATDEERLAEWDHTFDNLYYLTFRDRKSAELVSRLVDSLFRLAHPLYQGLMEGVKNEFEGELEELSYRFRSGRLADLGFPSLDEALAIYSPILPERFIPAGDKGTASPCDTGNIPLPAVFSGTSLLDRVLSRADSDTLNAELQYLINSALVVEEGAFGDTESAEAVFQRVHGWLNLALEELTDGDEEKALGLVRTEYLKRLLQLGFGIITSLRRKAEKLAPDSSNSNYATGKLLSGLKSARPRFYRGLDPDQIDGYREFRTIQDVRIVEALLGNLANSR